MGPGPKRKKSKKISTFDGPTFWKNAYAHQRAALLRMAQVPEGEIVSMAGKKYLELSSDVRYEIETLQDIDRTTM